MLREESGLGQGNATTVKIKGDMLQGVADAEIKPGAWLEREEKTPGIGGSPVPGRDECHQRAVDRTSAAIPDLSTGAGGGTGVPRQWGGGVRGTSKIIV